MTNRRVNNAIVQCIVLLVVVNVVSNRFVEGFPVVVTNILASLALVVIARRHGVTRAALGVDPGALRRGSRVARWLVLGLVVVFAVGVALPVTRDLFEDERVREMSALGVAYHALIAVPFGTVLLEEVAFRGVLPALFASSRSRWQGVVVASVLFGSWHVLPAWEIYRVNPVLRDLLHGTAGRVVGVSVGVVSTAFIGLAWCWLRYRTASLWTTIILHAASNSLGYGFAFLAWTLH
jgi:membrane protease YdiL (CAAX protease family)